MKLNLRRFGRKFFFLTLVTENRTPILSRINDDASVTLLEAGESVVACWRETHSLNAALTASNFIVMPDHIHLLLIVNYDLDPKFDLIDWIHDFMRRTQPRDPRQSLPWSRDYYLVLSFDSRQLKAIRHYIKLNPARKLWKQRHPDLFKVSKIPTARLLGGSGNLPVQSLPNPSGGSGDLPAQSLPNPSGGSGDLPRVIAAVGNLTLLGSPFLFHVRLTLKKTVEEHRAAIDEIIAKACQGWVPVSGFISPGEKEALRRLKAEPRARFIRILPNALPPRYDPSAEDSREIAAERLAIISLQPETTAISSLDIKRSTAASHGFRQNCLAMNDLAAALCAAAVNR